MPVPPLSHIGCFIITEGRQEHPAPSHAFVSTGCYLGVVGVSFLPACYTPKHTQSRREHASEVLLGWPVIGESGLPDLGNHGSGSSSHSTIPWVKDLRKACCELQSPP